MHPGFLKPFLVGVVAAPVSWAIFKPLMRGVVKGMVVLALEAKKLAAEAGEEFQDVAAEVSADMAKSRTAGDQGAKAKGTGVAR